MDSSYNNPNSRKGGKTRAQLDNNQGANSSQVASAAGMDQVPTEVSPAPITTATTAPAVTVPSHFPEKLMNLLLNNVAPDALWWLHQLQVAEGTVPKGSFAINRKVFSEELLNKSFNGNKWPSITRNLSRWGYRQIAYPNLPPNTTAYYNPLFQAEKPELLDLMIKNKARAKAFVQEYEKEMEEKAKALKAPKVTKELKTVVPKTAKKKAPATKKGKQKVADAKLPRRAAKQAPKGDKVAKKASSLVPKPPERAAGASLEPTPLREPVARSTSATETVTTSGRSSSTFCMDQQPTFGPPMAIPPNSKPGLNSVLNGNQMVVGGVGNNSTFMNTNPSMRAQAQQVHQQAGNGPTFFSWQQSQGMAASSERQQEEEAEDQEEMMEDDLLGQTQLLHELEQQAERLQQQQQSLQGNGIPLLRSQVLQQHQPPLGPGQMQVNFPYAGGQQLQQSQNHQFSLEEQMMQGLAPTGHNELLGLQPQHVQPHHQSSVEQQLRTFQQQQVTLPHGQQQQIQINQDAAQLVFQHLEQQQQQQQPEVRLVRHSSGTLNLPENVPPAPPVNAAADSVSDDSQGSDSEQLQSILNDLAGTGNGGHRRR